MKRIWKKMTGWIPLFRGQQPAVPVSTNHYLEQQGVMDSTTNIKAYKQEGLLDDLNTGKDAIIWIVGSLAGLGLLIYQLLAVQKLETSDVATVSLAAITPKDVEKVRGRARTLPYWEVEQAADGEDIIEVFKPPKFRMLVRTLRSLASIHGLASDKEKAEYLWDTDGALRSALSEQVEATETSFLDYWSTGGIFIGFEGGGACDLIHHKGICQLATKIYVNYYHRHHLIPCAKEEEAVLNTQAKWRDILTSSNDGKTIHFVIQLEHGDGPHDFDACIVMNAITLASSPANRSNKDASSIATGIQRQGNIVWVRPIRISIPGKLVGRQTANLHERHWVNLSDGDGGLRVIKVVSEIKKLVDDQKGAKQIVTIASDFSDEEVKKLTTLVEGLLPDGQVECIVNRLYPQHTGNKIDCFIAVNVLAAEVPPPIVNVFGLKSFQGHSSGMSRDELLERIGTNHVAEVVNVS